MGAVDIGLPEMNGYELAAAIRERLGDTIRLMAMSGYGQPDDVRRSEAAGFDRHLIKPVDPRRLAAALRDIRSEQGGFAIEQPSRAGDVEEVELRE